MEERRRKGKGREIYVIKSDWKRGEGRRNKGKYKDGRMNVTEAKEGKNKQ